MYLYPVWVRLWHLLNAILIIVLIISGAIMQYAGSGNSILTVAFAGASRWHKVASVILVISYIGFLIGNAITENGKHYRIIRKEIFPGIRRQFRYFIYGIFRGEKQPYPATLRSKFNPLQKLTYVLIMYFALPVIIITGLVLMIPDMKLIELCGNKIFIIIDILHIVFGLLISVFLVIHIYTCTLGPTPGSLFRAIITGHYTGDE